MADPNRLAFSFPELSHTRSCGRLEQAITVATVAVEPLRLDNGCRSAYGCAPTRPVGRTHGYDQGTMGNHGFVGTTPPSLLCET